MFRDEGREEMTADRILSNQSYLVFGYQLHCVVVVEHVVVLHLPLEHLDGVLHPLLMNCSLKLACPLARCQNLDLGWVHVHHLEVLLMANIHHLLVAF